MKKTTIIKSMLLSVAICAMMFTTSCKQEPKEEDTKEVAEEQNEAVLEEPKEEDSEFLVAAAETDMMKIEIGKLAQSKSTDANVKAFGKMLVDDHSKASMEMKPLAERMSVTLPAAITEKGKEHYDELNAKTGKEFDEKFADMMVESHEEAISKMEKASENANDAEVKAWAGKMVPALKGHLEHAKMLKEQVKNKK